MPGLAAQGQRAYNQVRLPKFLNAKGKSDCRKGVFGIRGSPIAPRGGESESSEQQCTTVLESHPR